MCVIERAENQHGGNIVGSFIFDSMIAVGIPGSPLPKHWEQSINLAYGRHASNVGSLTLIYLHPYNDQIHVEVVFYMADIKPRTLSVVLQQKLLHLHNEAQVGKHGDLQYLRCSYTSRFK